MSKKAEKNKAEKNKAREKASTRQLIGARAVTEYSLVTHGQGELVYFIVKPSNISVLSEASVGARIYALMTVLKGVAEIEMLCLNSRESFEDNKRFCAPAWIRRITRWCESSLKKTRPTLTGYRCRWRPPANS